MTRAQIRSAVIGDVQGLKDVLAEIVAKSTPIPDDDEAFRKPPTL
jgi:hypothetical protein